MRVRRAPAPGPGVPVPAELATFVESDWYDRAGRVPPELAGDWEPAAWRRCSARRRWCQARREWAAGHGFDPEVPYGLAPGADWWAFLALCRGEDAGWSPRSLAELNEPYTGKVPSTAYAPSRQG